MIGADTRCKHSAAAEPINTMPAKSAPSIRVLVFHYAQQVNFSPQTVALHVLSNTSTGPVQP